MKENTGRIVDYLIYVGAGLLLCLLAYGPLLLGVDISRALPVIEIGISAFLIVGILGYELRPWARQPILWAYLVAVAVAHIGFAYLMYERGLRINVALWILIGSLEILCFDRVFREFLGKSSAVR